MRTFAPKIFQTMKKYLPILLFVLLAFVGCDKKPAEYQLSIEGKNIIENTDAFTSEVLKNGPKYTAEDWEFVTVQFGMMCKDYKENEWRLFDNERNLYQQARMKYIQALDATNNPELQAANKKLFNDIFQVNQWFATA